MPIYILHIRKYSRKKRLAQKDDTENNLHDGKNSEKKTFHKKKLGTEELSATVIENKIDKTELSDTVP